MRGVSSFKTALVRALLVVMVVVATTLVAIILVATTYPAKERVYVEEVGFKTRGIDSLEYLANIYIGGELVRKIFMVIPTYSVTHQPLRIHIPVVKESVVRSLKVTFTPPPGKALDLAWVATTYNTQLKYYQEGASVVWQCDNMGVYGEATISLEFVPQYSKPNYFKGTVITITMILEYKGQQYTIQHSVIQFSEMTEPQERSSYQ